MRGRVKVRRRKRSRSRKRLRKSSRRRTASRRSKRNRGVSRASLTPKVEKIEDAKIVLVIGDFFAGGLADGLQVLLADSAGLRVVESTNGLSGLVRADVVNWPQRIGELVEEVKPAYIVAMVGANDRQLIREAGKKLKKRTPDWDTSYKRRVEAFGGALKATGLPYSWVGLPPMRLKSLSQDYLVFNEWYRAAAKAPQGKYVDVWDGFSDENGSYSRSGPDVSGQIVLLRPKDGINLTKAGRQRLAFYVASDIRKAVNDPSSLFAAGGKDSFGIESVSPEADAYDPGRTGRTVVVNLNDPTVDGVSVLAGEAVDFSVGVLKNVNKVPEPQISEIASKPTRQRVDSFSWPPKSYSPAQQTSSVATAGQ